MNERRTKIQVTAKDIIDQQYPDRLEFGIENHFLVDTMNQMILAQAPRIKEFVDALFNHGADLDDQHSLVMKIHMNTVEKSVLTIKDETIYGPNVDFIIVINDKVKGTLHIRKLKNKAELAEYKKNKYKDTQAKHLLQRIRRKNTWLP